jgi:hypothetical protein
MRWVCFFVLLATSLVSAATLQTGRTAGQNILPFSSNVVVGPHRGEQHCFVCDLKTDEVGVVFFARDDSAATARVVKGFLAQLRGLVKNTLVSWMVFLGPEGTAQEEALGKTALGFAEKYALTGENVCVFGGQAGGPPGYTVDAGAALTVVLFRNNEVLLAGAWPSAGWTEAVADGVLTDLKVALGKLAAPASPNH